MLPTRVDFYLLTSSEPQARWLLACRLLEKAYLSKQSIFVFCNHQQDAKHLDNLLWTFKDDSFIPHTVQDEEPQPSPTIHISYRDEAPPIHFNTILLNMADSLPKCYSTFGRIIELVSNTEQAKAISRDHYRDFRNQNYELNTHTID